ncbi:MAG: RluA family pseudouridine synthase [Alphaproteobacteria bacterium]|nr:RluA family pseudouridine synthase [Alphaproteobacteria bacterium]
MKKPFILTLPVEDSEGMRLDRWLRKHYPTLSQGIIEKLLRLGKIRLDGKKVTSGTRLSIGQLVEVPDTIDADAHKPLTPRLKPISVLTQEDEHYIESMILWEDEEVLVLNKPAGLATQGGSKTVRHLDGLLSAYGAKKGVRYRLVHRLDRDTSGVFLVAKTSDSATFLGEAFRKGAVKKIYWAIVVGQPKPGQGTINAPLLKGGDGNQEKVAVNKAGKPAITNYRTIKGLQKRSVTEFAWLELSPETGRTHQLRVHLTYIGCPILGDGKYGGQLATAASREMHLHSRAITFPDRLTGTPLTFMAPPPSHFETTLRAYKVDWEQMA